MSYAQSIDPVATALKDEIADLHIRPVKVSNLYQAESYHSDDAPPKKPRSRICCQAAMLTSKSK